MQQVRNGNQSLLPTSVIHAAKAGDPDAIETVLRQYEGYINRLCIRETYNASGERCSELDEYMKSRIQNKLIREIISHP